MNREFERLLAEFLDGDADRETVRGLRELVEKDVELRVRFREEIRLHTLLRETALEMVIPEADAAQGRFRWLMPVAVAAAALVAVGVWQVASGRWRVGRGEGVAESGSVAEIAATRGVVTRIRGETRLATAQGMGIRSGDSMETGADSGAAMRYVDGSMVLLNERTAVTILEDAVRRELTLRQGDVMVATLRPMVVNAGEFDETLVGGTVFEVCKGGDATVVRVAEGRVRFGAAKSAVTVEARQTSRATAAGVPSRPEILAEEEFARWRKPFESMLVLPVGVVVDERFAGTALSPFWVRTETTSLPAAGDGAVREGGKVVVGRNRLGLCASSDGTNEVTTAVVSRLTELGGCPLVVDIAYWRETIPLAGNPQTGIEIRDQTGRAVCAVWWRPYLSERKRIETAYSGRIGSEKIATPQVEMLPRHFRFVVDASGRVDIQGSLGAVEQKPGDPYAALPIDIGKGTVSAAGGEGIRAISVRLYVTYRGEKEYEAKWERVTILRLEKQPGIPEGTGKGG